MSAPTPLSTPLSCPSIICIELITETIGDQNVLRWTDLLSILSLLFIFISLFVLRLKTDFRFIGQYKYISVMALSLPMQVLTNVISGMVASATTGNRDVDTTSWVLHEIIGQSYSWILFIVVLGLQFITEYCNAYIILFLYSRTIDANTLRRVNRGALFWAIIVTVLSIVLIVTTPATSAINCLPLQSTTIGIVLPALIKSLCTLSFAIIRVMEPFNVWKKKQSKNDRLQRSVVVVPGASHLDAAMSNTTSNESSLQCPLLANQDPNIIFNVDTSFVTDGDDSEAAIAAKRLLERRSLSFLTFIKEVCVYHTWNPITFGKRTCLRPGKLLFLVCNIYFGTIALGGILVLAEDYSGVCVYAIAGVFGNVLLPAMLYWTIIADSSFWCSFYHRIPDRHFPIDMSLATEDVDIGKKIAAGAEGNIYVGRLLKATSATPVGELGWDIVIKEYAMSMDADSSESMYLHEEAMLAAVSPHPFIVSTYGVVMDPPFFCMILERADRGNLYDVLHYMDYEEGSRKRLQGISLSMIDRRRLAVQAADALLHVHRCDIAHRDVKSLNYLVFTRAITKQRTLSSKTREMDASVDCLPIVSAFTDTVDDMEVRNRQWSISSGGRPHTVSTHESMTETPSTYTVCYLDIKLTDFGRARVVSSRRQSTAQGTLGWAAPESLLDNRIVKDTELTRYVTVIEKLRRSERSKHQSWYGKIKRWWNGAEIHQRHLLRNIATWNSPECADVNRRRESSGAVEHYTQGMGADGNTFDSRTSSASFGDSAEAEMSYDAYAADVYSFGVVLYEIATGNDPPDADVWTHQEYYDRAVTRPYLTLVDSHCQDKQIADVIRRCTSLDPARRPSMLEVWTRLSDLYNAVADNESDHVCTSVDPVIGSWPVVEVPNNNSNAESYTHRRGLSESETSVPLKPPRKSTISH